MASPLNDVMETVDRDKTLHAWQQPMETWVAWRERSRPYVLWASSRLLVFSSDS